MEQIVTVPKIGTGTEFDPYRPDTTATEWEVIEETATTFTIRIFN